MNHQKRVMLLIDADNVSADVIDQAVAHVMAQHGAIHVRRAYCTAESALANLQLFKRHSIRPIVNLSTGKNSTDISLAVDAVDLVLAERPDVAVIVSSDSDFAPLVIRLREKGCRVEGIGQQGKTGEDSKPVYDEFIDLTHHKAVAGSRAAPRKRAAAKAAPASAAAASPVDAGAEAPTGYRFDERAEPPRNPAGSRARSQRASQGGSQAGEAPRATGPADELAAAGAAGRKSRSRSGASAARAPSAAPAGAPGEAAAVSQAVLREGARSASRAGARSVAQPARPAGARAGARNGVEAGERTGAGTGGRTGAGIGDETGERTGSRTGGRTGARTGARTDVQAGVQAGERTGAQTTERTAERTSERTATPAAETPLEQGAASRSANRLPDEVARILAAVPDLWRGGKIELGIAAEQLRAEKLLAKSATSTRLFKKFPSHFALTPELQPNKVQYVGPRVV